MIRFRFKGSDKHPEEIAFIGLSAENLHRLQEGMPIRIKADDQLGLGVETVIYYGRTEVSMTRELEENGFMPPGSTEETKRALREHDQFRYPPDA